MGDPVKIIDLARDMIKLSGLHLEDIQIQFTGLRPGEKLYEELLADDENTLPTMHEKVRIAQARITSPNWLDDALTWLTKLPTLTELEIKSELKIWVEEYQQDMSSQHKTSSHGLHVTNTTIH
jgi:FlaA1/EpsC-like NDP-sugar epimerase